jgi:hypothetical protein
MTLSIMTLSIITLSITIKREISIMTLVNDMLDKPVMLSVVMLNVVMLSVMAPFKA